MADGWLPAFLQPRTRAGIEPTPARWHRGGWSVTRRREDRSTVPVALAETVEARNLLRPILTFYFGAMGAKDKNFYIQLAARYGFGDVAVACQEAFLAGDRMGAAMALTPEVIDLAAIAATPATLENRLAAYADAGVDTFDRFAVRGPPWAAEGVVEVLAVGNGPTKPLEIGGWKGLTMSRTCVRMKVWKTSVIDPFPSVSAALADARRLDDQDLCDAIHDAEMALRRHQAHTAVLTAELNSRIQAMGYRSTAPLRNWPPCWRSPRAAPTTGWTPPSGCVTGNYCGPHSMTGASTRPKPS